MSSNIEERSKKTALVWHFPLWKFKHRERNKNLSIQNSSIIKRLSTDNFTKEFKLVVTEKQFVSRDEAKLIAFFLIKGPSELLSRNNVNYFRIKVTTTSVYRSIDTLI